MSLDGIFTIVFGILIAWGIIKLATFLLTLR